MIGFFVAKKDDLEAWVVEALGSNSGSCTVLEVAKYIWNNHEEELRKQGDIFYTWQYDMRWAAKYLRDQGVIKPATSSDRGVWELSE
jgi:hypothetical protein